MKYLIVVLLAALGLAGCAHATPINTGTGRAAYLIECHHMGVCVEKANEICPQGYSIANQSELNAGGGAVFVNPSANIATVTPNKVERSLTIECK